MTPLESAKYRFETAARSFESAAENLARQKWRDAALFARAAVEHAMKTIEACFTAVKRSHEPGQALKPALASPHFPGRLRARAEALMPVLAAYGRSAHIELSDGDEEKRLQPWDLVDEDRARRDVGVAHECLALARDCIAALFGEDKPA